MSEEYPWCVETTRGSFFKRIKVFCYKTKEEAEKCLRDYQLMPLVKTRLYREEK